MPQLLLKSRISAVEVHEEDQARGNAVCSTAPAQNAGFSQVSLRTAGSSPVAGKTQDIAPTVWDPAAS